MPKDVRTISDTIFFRDNTTGIASISLVDKDLIISNLTTGMIQIGDAASDVYIGNGTDSVDIIFEQNGEIRGLTGKTLTLGQSDSFITFAGDTTFNRNTYFNSGLFINRLAVGTGTGSPLAIIDIYDNFDNSIPSLRIFNPGSNFDPYIRFVPSSTGNSFSIGIDDSDNDLFKISSSTGLGLSDRLVITTGGFIGINTTSPESLLHVRGGSGPAWTPANKPTVYFSNDGTSNSYYVFGIKTSAADAMAVTNAGNVGIRTTTPNYPLDVNGTGNFSTVMTDEFIMENKFYEGAQVYSATNGIYVITNIASGNNSMVDLHVEGNSYSSSRSPSKFSVQCYNFTSSNDIVNRSAINFGDGPTGIDVFYNTDNLLCFWFTQTSSFQTYRFKLGTSAGSVNPRILSVTNATKPAFNLRNYTIVPFTAWNSNNDGAESTLDADLLDGQQGAYYTGFAGTISGILDSRLNTTGNTLISLINGKDNYQYWTLRGDSATTTQVQTTEQVQFTGAGNVTVTLAGTDNRTVTISGLDINNTYNAGSGLQLVGDTFHLGGTGQLSSLLFNDNKIRIGNTIDISKISTESILIGNILNNSNSSSTINDSVVIGGNNNLGEFSGTISAGTLIGRNILFRSSGLNNNHWANTFIGQSVGYSAIKSTNAIALGYYAAYEYHNIFDSYTIGSYSNYKSSGSIGDISIGYATRIRTLNTYGNIILGIRAGSYHNNTTGCISIGDSSSIARLNSNYSISIGQNSHGSTFNVDFPSTPTTFYKSDNAIAIGYYSSYESLETSYNISLGNYTNSFASGTYNVFIGSYAGAYATGNNNLEIVTSGNTSSIIGSNSNKIHINNILAGDTSTKRLAIGSVGAANLSPNSTLEILPNSSTDKVLIVKGAASQTANLTEWQNNAGNTLAYIDPTGGFSASIPSVTSGNNVVVVGSNGMLQQRNNAFYARGIGTVTTAAATVAKTVTINNYTLSSGDLLAITFTNGNSAAAPTLSVNSSPNYNIRLGNTNVSTVNFTLASGSVCLLYFDNSFFHVMGSQRLTDSDTTYSEIPESEILAGTASTLRTLTGRRARYLANRINASGIDTNAIYYPVFVSGTGTMAMANVTMNQLSFNPASGYFGLGTGNPQCILDIYDTGNNITPSIRIRNANANFDPYIRFVPSSTGNSYAIGIDDSDDDKFKISYGDDLGIGDRLIITTGGFVGINTGSPGFNLHVNGTGAFNAIRFSNGTVQTTAFTGIGGSTSITGPANAISFFSGNGALTGSSSLTYDPIKTSFTLTTQGNTPSTGFVIFNDQNQSGNVFQIRSYISDVNATTYNNQYIANTGDGSYTSNAGFNATNNLIDLIQGTGTFCTGFFPFSITGYVAGKTVIEDGANLTLTNNQVFATGLIEGEIAIYTGDANPQNPSNTGTLATQITKLSSAIPFSVEGSGSSSITDLDLSPLLGQYFALHPTNTGNVLFYYTVYPTTGSVSQNAIASASNPSTGLRPRLDVSFTVYEYAGTSTNKPIYSVDHVGRVKVGNIDRSDQLINSFLFYASGEPNQNANIQVESPNNGARVVFSQNNNLLYGMGTLPDRRFIIRSELFNTLPIMIFPQAENNFNLVLRSGYVGIKTNTPKYTLHVNGDGYMKSLRFFRYTNASQVPDTSRTLYSIGNNLFWNGSQLALGGDSSYTWTVRDGSNNSETVGDGTTVFWSGAGTVSTLYTAATNVMRISGSPGWNLGVGNAATVAINTNNNVTFTGLGNITVSRNGTQISISGSSAPATGSNYNWNLGVGNESTTTIASGNTVTFTGVNGIRTTRSTNQITLTGPHSVVNSGNVTTNAVVNLTSGTLQTFTLTGNTTFTVTGVTPGARFMLRLQQGSVGNYTATFNFPSGNIKWPGGSAPTISTGVGNATLVGFVHTSGTFFYDGFVIATGIR